MILWIKILIKSRTNKTQAHSKRSNISKIFFFYVILLCSLAFLILIQFNFYTILLGGLYVFSYISIHEKSYLLASAFLGLTFNWGIIMAWAVFNNEISIEIIILYLSAIFWTLGYDTIYGAQDMSDDEIIGLKSTSIKFKKNMKLFVSISYFITVALNIFLFHEHLSLNIFSFVFFMFALTLVYQIIKFNKDNSKSCLKMFKLNNLSGLFLFLSILSINNF